MKSKLPEGWKEVKLEEISKFNINNYRKNDDWEFVNYLDTGNITNGVVDEINLINLNEEKLPSRARRKVNKDDVIYSTVRPIQKHLGIIKKPLKNMLVSTGFTVITSNKEYLNPNYLYYYLNQNPLTQHLQSIAEQRVSTYPALNISDIKTLEIKLPPIKEQKVIANTLSTLDDKIELNNRINKNLEEQAQAIFKHWFIDFEFPDENGNPYKSSGGEMIESELGRIPKGWEVEQLEEVVSFSQGVQVPVKHQSPIKEKGYKRFIRIVDYTTNGTEAPRYVENKDKRYHCNIDDVVMVRYGNIGLLGRRIEGIIANNLFKIIPNKSIGKNYLYYFLNRDCIQSYIQGSSTGSAMPAIKHSTIGKIEFVKPFINIVNKFESIAFTVEKIIVSNKLENDKISQLRDTLLPKLMSGEIRIPLD